jgi:hypothetical protein
MGGTKTGVRVQTASKPEVRKAGFRPAPQIEEEEEGEEEEKNKEKEKKKEKKEK